MGQCRKDFALPPPSGPVTRFFHLESDLYHLTFKGAKGVAGSWALSRMLTRIWNYHLSGGELFLGRVHPFLCCSVLFCSLLFCSAHNFLHVSAPFFREQVDCCAEGSRGSGPVYTALR